MTMAMKLTCREVIEFLGAWIEGELDEPTRAGFDRHLAVCPSCVAYLATYRRTILLAREAWADEVEPSLPEELVAAVMAARG